jgi:hypothetical protein
VQRLDADLAAGLQISTVTGLLSLPRRSSSPRLFFRVRRLVSTSS